jgi:hypothetical protein
MRNLYGTNPLSSSRATTNLKKVAAAETLEDDREEILAAIGRMCRVI